MLNRRTRYLEVALNSTLIEAYAIIDRLPKSERILVEAGTPLIKRYGTDVIGDLKKRWGGDVIADLKTMDRGETEVRLAKDAGASAVICLGLAPIETINACIASCKEHGLDSMVDMMNVDYPVGILRKLKKLPTVVMLHRGVDEETFNKNKPIPYIHINKIRSSYDVLIAIAGGDTIREVQRAAFNDANIVVVWKEFFNATEFTGNLAEEFLRAVK
ncbi:MAG: orotidine 5'-phosphate decarboxylase / HUMPS family protein [bacterium]|nr:orotidine 5'-phosphate decarboxylase / HUMPS family protein [bacterium]